MAIPVAALNAYAQAARMGSGSAAGQAAGSAKDAAGGGGFGHMLEKALDNMISTGKASEHQMAVSTAGKENSMVDVVTAVSEAETTLQTVVAVRDKVISAYQEIIRMPI
jgi:flagellar hook-basal body complex protein FliE